MREDASCFDLIYTPAETQFLRDARHAGHPTLNGRPMNLAQAADAFAHKILPDVLARHGLGGEPGYDRVFAVMAQV
jgi:shikimate 5-dehydrogenase